VQSAAATIKEYLAALPPERGRAIDALRKLILDRLPAGYAEVMQWGMICYIIPLKRYSTTYNGQPLALAALASQKNYLSLYLMTVYGDKATGEWFKSEYAKTGKKLNMGKSCLRFKSLEEIPLELIGRTIARVSVDKYIEAYEKAKRVTG
jgi:hypothetical protein